MGLDEVHAHLAGDESLGPLEIRDSKLGFIGSKCLHLLIELVGDIDDESWFCGPALACSQVVDEAFDLMPFLVCFISENVGLKRGKLGGLGDGVVVGVMIP